MERNTNLLIIDDEVKVITSLKRLLRKDGYTIFSAQSAEEALNLMVTCEMAVVVSDYMMPGVDGLAFFEMLKGKYDQVVKILLTGKSTMESALESINRLKLFGYMTKPWPAEDIRAMLRNAFEHYNLMAENYHYQSLIREQNKQLSLANEKLEEQVQRRTKLLEDAVREGVMMLATAAEEKDKETGNHLQRIQMISLAICGELNISKSLAETISLFSVTHDVGKIHIPDRVLNKRGPLDDEEWIIMRGHTIAGEKILGKKKYYAIAREIARSHHENWDGTGYPDGISGEQIPLPARIVAVADVFDALRSKRPYKEAWDIMRTTEELRRLSGRKFDPNVLEAFFRVLAKRESDNFTV